MQRSHSTYVTNNIFFKSSDTREYLAICKRTLLSMTYPTRSFNNQFTDFPYQGDFSSHGDPKTGYTNREIMGFWMSDSFSIHQLSSTANVDFGDDKMYILFIQKVSYNPLVIYYRFYYYNQTRGKVIIEQYCEDPSLTICRAPHIWFLFDLVEYLKDIDRWTVMSREEYDDIKKKIDHLIKTRGY
jgi:hypothetical protein